MYQWPMFHWREGGNMLAQSSRVANISFLRIQAHCSWQNKPLDGLKPSYWVASQTHDHMPTLKVLEWIFRRKWNVVQHQLFRNLHWTFFCIPWILIYRICFVTYGIIRCTLVLYFTNLHALEPLGPLMRFESTIHMPGWPKDLRVLLIHGAHYPQQLA